MNVIETYQLSKQYRYFEKQEGLKGSLKSLFKRETKVRDALCDFTLSVEAGEFVGLMGPNGAGKTTLIKLLTGIMQPTSGEVVVNGYNPAKGETAFKKSFAVVMGQKSQLWWDLPASDSLLLNKAIYEIPDRQYKESVAYFTKLFDVERYLSVQVRKLSLGERMKFELIAALLHTPKLLLLDEPTIGLDAVAQRQIREMLKAAGRERGITLLLTSHYTEDLLDLTKRCVVMKSGRKLYDGDMEKLLAEYKTSSMITIAFSSEGRREPLLPSCTELEAQSDYALTVRVQKDGVRECMQALMELPDIEDIKISEDDVTLLVERVYKNI